MGACFKALFMGVPMTALDFSRNFFHILTFGFEQCGEHFHYFSANMACVNINIALSVVCGRVKDPCFL